MSSISDIYWLTFNDNDGTIKCICPQHDKKCKNKKDMYCEEYLLKFSKIERNKDIPTMDDLLLKNISRTVSELEKSLKRKRI